MGLLDNDVNLDWNDLECLKYTRIGYIDQGRHSDALVKTFTQEIPGDGELPHRWKYTSLNSFLSRFGDLGTILWAKSYNSHLLIINGHRILRIWTDTKSKCWVDVHITLASMGSIALLDMQKIPEKNVKKSNPFEYRVCVTTLQEMKIIAKTIKDIWGI